MAPRSYFALDSENLVVTSSSSAGIVGNPVINNSDTPDGTVFEYSSGGGSTVTVEDTGGSPDVFDDDNSANHIITDGGGLVADGTPVEAESLIFVQQLDAQGDPVGPVITLTVFSQNGVTGDVWGFSTDTPLINGASYVKTGGSNFGSSLYDNFVTCFGPGTMIAAEEGARGIETLQVGDMVWTQDGTYKAIRWLGRSTVPAIGAAAPIVFEPGAIQNTDRLIVSQEHRMCLGGYRTQLLFAQEQVLIAAKHMTDIPGVTCQEGGMITYTHFMFDRHEIVDANGQLCESFFLSDNALRGVDDGPRDELLALFPSLQAGIQAFGPAAAQILKRNEAELLASQLKIAA